MSDSPREVYFFGTCLIDLFFPNAGLAGMELLRREGVEVIFPQRQSCCGQPAWNSGYRDEAREVARRQLAVFRRELPVVVPSASCAGMIRKHYPKLFNGQRDAAQAQALAARTYELTEYLVDVLGVAYTDLGAPTRVAVHHSCSSRRETRSAGKTHTLLRSLANIDLHEAEHASECCGFGGTFSVKQPAISAAMVADKSGELRATGAEVVVSQDCGCLMNIKTAFEAQGGGPRCVHLAELLLERTE